MSLKLVFILLSLAGLSGVLIGYYLRLIIALGKKGSLELKLKEIELSAKNKEQEIISEAENKALKILNEAKQEIKEKEEKNQKTEERLVKKEEFLDDRQRDIDKEVEMVKEKVVEIKKIREEAEKLLSEREMAVQKVAGMSKEQAKEELLSKVERDYENDILSKINKIEKSGEEKFLKKAQEILATSIQRLSNSVTADMMTTTVAIPSDEIKGKIIGREGRNIKAFERVTGVELIVDDTPGFITISSFDPVRRQVAKFALENLIADGRIQPAKIEEMVEKAQNDINKIIKQKGEEAVFECGIMNFDPKLVSIIGRLHFRTSYGQNVLAHSIEMAHIAGMLAEELKADVSVAKAGALVHDIGKALDHEVSGTHVEIGRRILQKFGVDEAIIKAMQAHHEEYPYETIESIIVQCADAISGSRPGARRDSVENYIKRLTDLENLASSFKGVEKAYALQAGREIRIFVSPADVTDLQAKNMARDIAIRIEEELKYPGEIKVTLIRENRVVDYAR
jgi:ribonuclease Y